MGRSLRRTRSIMDAPSWDPVASLGSYRSHAEQHGGLASRGDAILEVLDQEVTPHQHRADLVLHHDVPHHVLDALERQCAHALEQATLAPGQLIGPEQLLPGAEGTSVVDHPEGPVLGPQDVAPVAIAVLNQLV